MNTKMPIPGAWTQDRILITGARGFMGSALATALSAEAPTAITMLSRGDFNGIRPRSGMELVKLDLLNRTELFDFCASRNFDYVFHLAGKIDQSNRPGVYQEQFCLHVETTINLTDALASTPLKRFIHIGSAAEYGVAPCPHTVEVHEEPVTAYAVSKLASSRLVLTKALSEGLPATVVRPYLVYGKGQGPSSLLQSSIEAARTGKTFLVAGLEQTRDFVSLQKFCGDLLAIAKLPTDRAVGRIHNICTGVEISVREVLDMVSQLYPKFKHAAYDRSATRREIMRSSGEPFRGLSSEDARRALLNFLTEMKASAVEAEIETCV